MERRVFGVEEQEAPGDCPAVCRGEDAVHEPGALGVALREVERHLVAGDGGITADPHLFVEGGAVIVRGRLAVVGTVRHLVDRGADVGLHTVEHLLDAVEDRLLPVLVEQRVDALLTDGEASHQRVVVDLDTLGEAHVVPYQFEHVGPFDAAVVDLDRWDHQPLGVNVVAVGEVATGERATGVELMTSCEQHEDQFVLVEDRADESPVREVVAVTLERVVRDDDVTGVEVVSELFEDGLDGEVLREEHRCGSLGDRYGACTGVPDACCHVVQLGQQVILGGPVDDVAHLSGDALHAMPDGRQRDRVDCPAVVVCAVHEPSPSAVPADPMSVRLVST